MRVENLFKTLYYKINLNSEIQLYNFLKKAESFSIQTCYI